MSGMRGHAHSGNKDGGRHYRRAVGLVNLREPKSQQSNATAPPSRLATPSSRNLSLGAEAKRTPVSDIIFGEAPALETPQ